MEIPDIKTETGLDKINPEDINKIKLQLQEINDTIMGGLRSANLKEYRNTYVINAQDSLDANYPLYIHFNIIPEMVKIVSIQISFWFLNFRAYSTAASSGGGATSGAGGGQTSSSVATPSGGGATSGATGSASGGGATSSSGGGQTSSETTTPSGGGATSGVTGGSILTANNSDHSVSNTVASGTTVYGVFIPAGGMAVTDKTSLGAKDVYPVSHKHYLGDHTHTTPNHTHPVHTHTVANHTHSTPDHTHPNHTHSTPDHTHPNHTHTITDHTHTTPDHTHGITYGIFEDSTSPTVMLFVSRDNGLSYSLPVGSYSKDHENLDITSMINSAGSKLIKFTSNARTRLSVQITVKLDISAR